MTDIWAPNMMWDNTAISSPGWSWFRIWGRLQPGTPPDQARAVLQTVFTNFRRERAAGAPADAPRDLLRYLPIPTPPMLEEALGYRGRLRFVAFYIHRALPNLFITMEVMRFQ